MNLQSFISRFMTPPKGGDPKPRPQRAQAVATASVDHRKYTRSRIACRVIVSLEDAKGAKRQVQSRGVDMSTAGALILSPEPIAVGSAVDIHLKELLLMGTAVVRHCSEQKSKFLIGLEFRGSLFRPY